MKVFIHKIGSVNNYNIQNKREPVKNFSTSPINSESKQISFSGIFDNNLISKKQAIECIDKLYSSFEKQPSYTKEQSLENFRKRLGYSNTCESVLNVLSKISKKFRNKIYETILTPKDKDLRASLGCINLLLDKKVNDFDIYSILDISVNFNGEFDPDVTKTALELKNRYDKDDYLAVLEASLDTEGNFSYTSLELTEWLYQNLDSDNFWQDLDEIMFTYHSEWQKFHAKEGRCFLKQLVKTNYPMEQIKQLYTFAIQKYNNSPEGTNFGLMDNIPTQLKTQELISSFIINRIQASSDDKGCFKKNHYELYNNIAKNLKQPSVNKFSLCKDFTKLALTKNDQKHPYTDLALDCWNKKGPLNGILLLEFCEKYPKKFNWLKKLIEDDNCNEPSLVAIKLVEATENINYIDTFLSLKKQKNNIFSDAELIRILTSSMKDGEIAPAVLNFIKESLDNKNLQEIICSCLDKEKNEINTKKMHLRDDLENLGYNNDTREKLLALAPVDTKKFLDNVNKLKNINITYIDNILYDSENYRIPIEKYILAKECIKEAIDKYKVFIPNYSEKLVDYLLFTTPRVTMNMFDLLGEKAFGYAIIDGEETFKEHQQLLGVKSNMPEKVLQIINPKVTQKYCQIINQINTLKKEFSKTNGKSKEELIKEINNLTKTKNNMLKQSLQDPKVILDTAIMFKRLLNTPGNLSKKMIEELNVESFLENPSIFANKIYLNILGINDNNEKCMKNFDLSDNKYLLSIFKSKYEFKKEFQTLWKTIRDSQLSTVSEILNNLPQNIETKKILEKNGINYEKYVSNNPNLKLNVNLLLEKDIIVKNLASNIENDFNNKLFDFIPDEERKKLLDEIKKNGVYLQEIKSNDKFKHYRFFTVSNDNLYLKANMLNCQKKIIKALTNILKTDNFWNTKHNDKNLDNAISTFKDHILNLRQNELKDCIYKIKNIPIQVTIQKVDMDNISHSLFLGSHSACCTSPDGCNGWSAPLYILNKAVQAIEIKTDKDYIGNTMCFLIKTADGIGLLLDNFELKSKFQYNKTLRDAVIEFAKQFCNEIGNPNMPIYVGAHNQKFEFEGEKTYNNMDIILGESGENEVYVDSSPIKDVRLNGLITPLDYIRIN